jgi:hypothetical protein
MLTSPNKKRLTDKIIKISSDFSVCDINQTSKGDETISCSQKILDFSKTTNSKYLGINKNMIKADSSIITNSKTNSFSINKIPSPAKDKSNSGLSFVSLKDFNFKPFNNSISPKKGRNSGMGNFSSSLMSLTLNQNNYGNSKTKNLLEEIFKSHKDNKELLKKNNHAEYRLSQKYNSLANLNSPLKFKKIFTKNSNKNKFIQFKSILEELLSSDDEAIIDKIYKEIQPIINKKLEKIEEKLKFIKHSNRDDSEYINIEMKEFDSLISLFRNLKIIESNDIIQKNNTIENKLLFKNNEKLNKKIIFSGDYQSMNTLNKKPSNSFYNSNYYKNFNTNSSLGNSVHINQNKSNKSNFSQFTNNLDSMKRKISYPIESGRKTKLIKKTLSVPTEKVFKLKFIKETTEEKETIKQDDDVIKNGK